MSLQRDIMSQDRTSNKDNNDSQTDTHSRDERYPLQVRGRIFQLEKYATILSYSCEVECVS